MNRTRNTIILLLLFFIIKLMISCGMNNDIYPIYFFDYTTLKVSARSVWYSNIDYDTVTVDKVNRNKIRLNLSVSDTVKSHYLGFSKLISNLNGYETVSANEPLISEYYTANQNIKRIEIYTLQNINDSIHSGDDISNEFLVDNGDILYTRITNADKILNKEYYINPYNTINLVCKIPAKAATGQFRVKVILSNDKVLEAETLPIKFIENDEY